MTINLEHADIFAVAETGKTQQVATTRTVGDDEDVEDLRK